MRISLGLWMGIWMVLGPIASVLLGFRLSLVYAYSALGIPNRFVPLFDIPVLLLLAVLVVATIHKGSRLTRFEAGVFLFYAILLACGAAFLNLTIYSFVIGAP